jgi:hypothetical protein
VRGSGGHDHDQTVAARTPALALHERLLRRALIHRSSAEANTSALAALLDLFRELLRAGEVELDFRAPVLRFEIARDLAEWSGEGMPPRTRAASSCRHRTG